MPNFNTISVLTGLTQGNVTATTAFAAAAGGSVRGLVQLPAGGMWDGRSFRLRASYRITGGTTTNYTPVLYWNSGNNTNLTTFTNDIVVCAGAAFAVNTVTRTAFIEAIMCWDVVSQRLVGNFCVQEDSVFTAFATLTNPGTGIATQQAIQFTATGIFSGTNANNAAILTEFALEQL